MFDSDTTALQKDRAEMTEGPRVEKAGERRNRREFAIAPNRLTGVKHA